MRDYCVSFKGKKITVMGLGLLGRGVGDVEFLAKCGAEVLVTDRKSEVELVESVAKLKQYPNVAFRLGGHDIADFTSVDMVIKAAGVPLDSPEITAAREAGVPVYMSTALFAKMAMEEGATVVGVTGTRGKSTTTQIIYHCLSEAKALGLNRADGAVGRTMLQGNIVLGGNVRGLSTLALLPQVERGDLVVLELDSWQLQGFGDLRISPHVAVFTNLKPDHMNYYDGDMEKYFADKANIFKFQKKGDVLIYDPNLSDRVSAVLPADVHTIEPVYPLPQDWCPHLLGEHNLYNAALASAALAVLGLSEDEIRAGLATFKPVEGRLQLVRKIRGVKVYNDNNATTPEAAIAGLRALGSGITLITGGSEKGLELKELVEEIRRRASHVIVLTHPRYQGSERLMGDLREANVAFVEAASLERAVELAFQAAHTAGSILFSPAFASFGMFKNEYDRNDRFLQLVGTHEARRPAQSSNDQL